MPEREPTPKEIWFANALQYGLPVLLILFFVAANAWGWDIDKIFSMVIGSAILFVPLAAMVCLALCLLLAPIASAFFRGQRTED